MEDLINAMSVKHSQNLSYRKAASMFHVPKSTLYLYDTGKIEVGAKQGPPTVLTAAEEEKLVQYAVHMSRIGYGRTKEQILDVVQALVKEDGRPNPFTNDHPGKRWWELFKKCHPALTLRLPEHLQLPRARCYTLEVITAWFSDFELFLAEHNVKDSPTQIWNADEAGFSLCPCKE